jgi:hypothetical protein
VGNTFYQRLPDESRRRRLIHAGTAEHFSSGNRLI